MHNRLLRYSLLVTLSMFLLLNQTGSVVTNAATSPCTKMMVSLTKKIAQSCTSIDNNQLCNANPNVDVQFQDGVTTPPTFAKIGDMIAFDQVKTLATSAQNNDAGTWGIAILKARASALDNTVNGQAVTFILYGSTNLSASTTPITPNAGTPTPAPTCQVTTTRFTTMRDQPDNPTTVKNIANGSVVTLSAQSPDGKWLYGAVGTSNGWIAAQNLPTLDSTCSQLPTDDPTTPMALQGINAMYFSTDIAPQATCNDVPMGGLIIRSSTGRGINVNLDGATLTVHSTVVLTVNHDQATQQGDQLQVSVIRGHVDVKAQNQVQSVIAGQKLSLPLGAVDAVTGAVNVTGAPSTPVKMSSAELVAIPADPCTVVNAAKWCGFVVTQAQSQGRQSSNKRKDDD